MFTGIIQEIGQVKKIVNDADKVYINIACKAILKDVKLGDSIAVNGVCLTVCDLDSNSFTADVMPETVSRTSLKSLTSGSSVNLEPALTLSTRLGGHLVSGHVDGMGKIIRITHDKNAEWFEIEASPSILRYIVPKGSVSLDGTSLTVVDAGENSFTVSLIPHTRKVSIFGERRVGDNINIECDIVGKYIEKFVLNKNDNFDDKTKNNKKDSITMDFLIDNGFV